MENEHGADTKHTAQIIHIYLDSGIELLSSLGLPSCRGAQSRALERGSQVRSKRRICWNPEKFGHPE